MNKFKIVIILMLIFNTTIQAQDTVEVTNENITVANKGLVDLVEKLSKKIDKLEKQINKIELKNKNILPEGPFPANSDIVTLPSFGIVACYEGAPNFGIYALMGGRNNVRTISKVIYSDLTQRYRRPYLQPIYSSMLEKYVIHNYYPGNEGNGRCEILSGEVNEGDIRVLINTNSN